MCLLLESIQIRNGILMNSSYHQERMNSSSLYFFGKRVNFNLSSLVIPPEAGNNIFKCRILYKTSAEMIEFEPYLAKKIHSLKLVFDNKISYSYKFADRSNLIELLKQKGPADDILIVKNGRITDTSYSNVVFRKGKEYYTPSTFQLNGTKRQQLLKDGLVEEDHISVDDISGMDSIIPINSMLDINNSENIKISSIIF